MFFDDFQTRDQNYHLMLANIFSFENIPNNSINNSAYKSIWSELLKPFDDFWVRYKL